MDSIYYCGLSFCVSYYPERCSVYPDPYYFCSYHGLETDILNLTACWGYELWKFSTTCTLVIESVKATSVIFLLGVGSLVCYKLYSHYRKKPEGPPPGKKLRLLRWGSEELIESNTDLDSDLQNIESKYFGPEENNTEDVASEFSDIDTDECSSFSESLNLYSDYTEDTLLKLSDIQMGNLHGQYEPVVYNIQAGVNIPDSFLSGYHHSPSYLSNSKNLLIPSKSKHSGRSRKFNFGALLAKSYVDDINNSALDNKILNEKKLRRESLCFNDLNNDDWLYGHSQHGSEADIESLGSPSINYGDNDLEDFMGEDLGDSDAASLKANFSPNSLKGRRSLLDRLPPDGADSHVLHEGIIKHTPLEDENCDIILKDLFGEDVFDLENEHEDLASGIGYQGRLMRDQSFDSDVSELSFELSLQDNIGSNTVQSLDHLLSHIHQIKQSCLNLDAEIVNLKGLKKSSSFSTLKSTSDSSEPSASHSGSAMEMVAKHKSRASFKGLLDRNAYIPELTDKSTGSSNVDVPSSSTGNIVSGELSLEWESPVVKSSETKSSEKEKNSTLPLTTTNSNFIALDSGSDFGTSLTSESPDIGPPPSSSSVSLEWDEEFECRDDGDDLQTLTFINKLDCDQTPKFYSDDDLMIARNDEEMEIDTNIDFIQTLSPTLNQERIVPGQSHECSPEENFSSLADMNEAFDSQNVVEDGADIAINIPKPFPSWSLCTYADDSSYDTLKESPSVAMNPNDPQWASTESGFGEGTIITSPSNERDEILERKVEMRRKNQSDEAKVNRDSAYCDDMELNLPRTLENVSEKWDLILYSETEWKAHTSRAEIIRKGYAEIPSHLGCYHMRRIRGDNYCAIRAAIFQVLVHDLPVLDRYGGLECVQQKLENWSMDRYLWLHDWSFGNRLPYSKVTCIQGFQECLSSLHQISLRVNSSSRKEEFLVSLLNSDPDLDVRLMEAVKLLMMISSIELHEEIANGKEMSVFPVLLFIRDTSETPRAFMVNHLNMVGDSGGLEQIEMSLLGYTLGVTILVVRPSMYGQEDYVCRYPYEVSEKYPEIKLLAEDDRHYNIIVS